MKLLLLALAAIAAASAQSVQARLESFADQKVILLQLRCPDQQMKCTLAIQAEYLDATGLVGKSDSYNVDVAQASVGGIVVPGYSLVWLRTQDKWPDSLAIYRSDPALRIKLSAPTVP